MKLSFINMVTEFKFVDLFSGIGGFKLALSANGGHCVAYSEINSDAINTYCENHQIRKSLNLGDITKIDALPQHDVLTAGVPCQSWSIAGKNLGFNDDRGQLWNDTIYLLNKSRPKAFIFENVKGLVDPRNSEALTHILNRIVDAGYYADHFVINSHDYGVAQNRIRIYVVGFLDKRFLDEFKLPKAAEKKIILADVLGIRVKSLKKAESTEVNLFGVAVQAKKMSLSAKNGLNDYFLFNDLRNGLTTIHSWDIGSTTNKQKMICLLLLKNRRKNKYGPLDGNPLSLSQLQSLDTTIIESELNELVKLRILKELNYRFEILKDQIDIDDKEELILKCAQAGEISVGDLKCIKHLKIKRISITDTLKSLQEKRKIRCIEKRFDFKNTKISSGLNGINRIFMPTSDLFPTLVASDTNDYVATKCLDEIYDRESYKQQFMEQIYYTGKYRKITKQEACEIQGFPTTFVLPKSRSRWMKLIGNSVSVPVIDILIKAIISTGALEQNDENLKATNT